MVVVEIAADEHTAVQSGVLQIGDSWSDWGTPLSPVSSASWSSFGLVSVCSAKEGWKMSPHVTATTLLRLLDLPLGRYTGDWLRSVSAVSGD